MLVKVPCNLVYCLLSNFRTFTTDGGNVVVDVDSLKLIEGSTIDFQEELIKSGFVVMTNPNADKGCSCGISFSLKI